MYCIKKFCTSSADVEFAGHNSKQSDRHKFATDELRATLHVLYADAFVIISIPKISISSVSLLIDMNFIIYFHFPILKELAGLC